MIWKQKWIILTKFINSLKQSNENKSRLKSVLKLNEKWEPKQSAFYDSYETTYVRSKTWKKTEQKISNIEF